MLHARADNGAEALAVGRRNDLVSMGEKPFEISVGILNQQPRILAPPAWPRDGCCQIDAIDEQADQHLQQSLDLSIRSGRGHRDTCILRLDDNGCQRMDRALAAGSIIWRAGKSGGPVVKREPAFEYEDAGAEAIEDMLTSEDTVIPDASEAATPAVWI